MTAQSSKQRPKFLKPAENWWEEDKSEIDPNNATTFVYNPYVSFSLEQQRQQLPIFSNRSHILYLLENFQTLVLVGETGCGKSTQVPQYLVEAGWAADGKIVGVTEPRRVAATTLAMRVADEKNCMVGQLVGYSIRFDDHFDPEHTKIKYMTEGILLREMMADPLLRNYCVIMLDEVHERTLFTDIVMGLLKKILRKRKNLKLIVTSATVDAEHLKNFFSHSPSNKDTAVIMSVHGRLYPVSVYYLKEPVADYVQGVVDTVIKIHENEPLGDILAFLTGQEEVERAVSVLKERAAHLKSDKGKLLILPMYGSLPNGEQLKVFRFTPRGMRKVVISTNIAETSVTIPGIVYVVDCGFVKLRWFNPENHADSLVVVPVSQASAEQRAGRAGRVRVGKVYRLYTEEAFKDLVEATPPEMQRTDLSMAILQLKALGIDNVLRFNFPSPPPAKNLLSGLELLYALGALDRDGQLTKPLGVTMAEFPIEPLFSKCLIISGEFGCSEEMLSIIAMLQVQNVFTKPSIGQLAIKARIAKRKFEVSEGDLLTYLNVYNSFIKHEMSREWCHTNFLNYKGLRRASEIRQQMSKLLHHFSIPITSCEGNTEVICRCITAGLFPNAVYLHYSGVYKTVRGDQVLNIHPTSVIYTLEQPQWLLYCEILYTNEAYMRDLTVIEPSWLEELAPHFYQKTVDKDY
ncbi:probable ATP-dependent RNA helicase DHX35 isoform X1 [Schistocerca cancellata]|uniref:probable ATP-dependent RNA helicase DHX35 isoform X1 n=1 Tax=Schistocerca cancellata TaxID=274614 RepID=UPI00211777E5|nr:probable ATP-dependent RNA helicase DHX35 isoform X1 [Schistocerca cancellata]XP_049762764.1 probable ATP-dependent RNA helicase DHX35 isoform X1 [Schistocerca cancellata]XP_049762765.1 probable ATP-dependent RNA helicase DHX35 isoform X1 [Schistocerca cancellata]XP_049762766.1 probable ATP-dependent RNA helicase DHX35 isoform X1 [Schistocerca cancellata]